VVMRHIVMATLWLTFLGSTGCLSVHEAYPLGPAGPDHAPVVVWSVLITATPTSLSQLTTTPEEPGLPPEREQELIREQMDTVGKDLRESIEAKLNQWQGIACRNVSPEAPSPGADLQLTITLSDYGRLKKKWIRWMLITGASEALVQGVVTASVLNSTLAGVAVGAEELASEWITWHGGAWLYARTFSPVTLEGRMIRVADGKTVWRKTEFVSKDKEALARLPEADRDRKEVRLAANLHKAERLLLEDLSAYLEKQHIGKRVREPARKR